MRCVLGVDSGGTKSDVLLVRDDGIVLGHGYVDYLDPASGRGVLGSGRSDASVSRAIAQAIGEYTCQELYFSAVSKTEPEKVIPVDRVEKLRVHWIYESDPALALAHADAGIVVLSGTGAMIHVRTRDGRFGRFDGMGPLLGDFGSGYYIGYHTLRAITRATMHPRHATALSQLVLEHFGFAGEKQPFRSLVRYSLEQRDRAEIAGLARVVDSAAEAGDRVAIDILRDAAAATAETVCDAVDFMGIMEENYPMIASGSIAMRSRIYWEHLSALVLDYAPCLTPVRPEFPPVVGLALITLRQLAATDQDTLQHNLFSSAREALGMKN